MKKWTHLVVFAVLSGIATLMRLWGVITNRVDEAAIQNTVKELEKVGVPVSEDLMKVARATAEFQGDIINKILVILLFFAMVAMIVFLVQKKYELSSYTYIGYLLGTLILSTYSFIGTKGIAQLHSDTVLRQATEVGALGAYIFLIVLFLIYFGLTVFFHLRKPKTSELVEDTGI